MRQKSTLSRAGAKQAVETRKEVPPQTASEDDRSTPISSLKGAMLPKLSMQPGGWQNGHKVRRPGCRYGVLSLGMRASIGRQQKRRRRDRSSVKASGKQTRRFPSHQSARASKEREVGPWQEETGVRRQHTICDVSRSPSARITRHRHGSRRVRRRCPEREPGHPPAYRTDRPVPRRSSARTPTTIEEGHPA